MGAETFTGPDDQEVSRPTGQAGLESVLPVILPGGSVDDIPIWLRPYSTGHYEIAEFTKPGVERLVRVLTGQPRETVPPLGKPDVLPPRGHEMSRTPVADGHPTAPGLHSEVLITASLTGDGRISSSAWLAGAQLCRQERGLPFEVGHVWAALDQPVAAATDRMIAAGRELAAVLLDTESQHQLAAVLDRLGPDDSAEIVLHADGPLLALPVELIRLATASGGEVGPLALMPAVSVSRRMALPGGQAADPSVLARTPHWAAVAGHQDAQVRVLEVASLAAIAVLLAAADPGNTQWQRDLVYVRARISDLERREGTSG